MTTRLGIDLGGTKAALCVRRSGEPSRRAVLSWPPGDDADADLAAIADAVRGMVADPGSVASVGVAVAATLDHTGRVAAWPTRPGWVGLDLHTRISEQLPGATVLFADDGDLATIAEAHQAGGADLLYVGVGTGVGGGLFLGGRLLRSAHGAAAEVGHMVVGPLAAPCRCGRRGCVQAVASGPAVLARAARRHGRPVDAATLRAAIADGSRWATASLSESANALARAIVSVCELVRPGLVRIGGGFAAAVPELPLAVADAVHGLARQGHPAPIVEPAAHGPHSSLAGAVLLAGDPTLLADPGPMEH